jgi:hypothetical protein
MSVRLILFTIISLGLIKQSQCSFRQARLNFSFEDCEWQASSHLDFAIKGINPCGPRESVYNDDGTFDCFFWNSGMTRYQDTEDGSSPQCIMISDNGNSRLVDLDGTYVEGHCFIEHGAITTYKYTIIDTATSAYARQMEPALPNISPLSSSKILKSYVYGDISSNNNNINSNSNSNINNNMIINILVVIPDMPYYHKGYGRIKAYHPSPKHSLLQHLINRNIIYNENTVYNITYFTENGYNNQNINNQTDHNIRLITYIDLNITASDLVIWRQISRKKGYIKTLNSLFKNEKKEDDIYTVVSLKLYEYLSNYDIVIYDDIGNRCI